MLAPIGDRSLRHYNRILQKAYPDCRIRWSERQEAWLLERKANYARTDVDPSKYPAEAIDTFIQRRDGYYLAGRYSPRRLPPADLLVKILQANDPNRMDVPGTTAEEQARNFCDMLEERERAEIAKAREDNSFHGSGVGSELYDQLAWAEGRRVAVPTNATGVGVEK